MNHTPYDVAFDRVVSHEAGFQKIFLDRGNWTGGRVGSGKLRGTKYGISAAAYPDLDIENLTLDDVRRIYRRDYWMPIRGDELPLPLVSQVFDMSVHSGPGAAIKTLQRALLVHADGILGPITLQSLHQHDPLVVGARFLAYRMRHQTEAKGWPDFGRGWTNRNAEQLLMLVSDCELQRGGAEQWLLN